MARRESLEAATLDTLPITVAVVDEDGEILLTNESWRAFGSDEGRPTDDTDLGVDYVAVTEGADDEYARNAADGLRAVLDGDRESFSMEYPCHSPDEKRWFLMRASRFTVDGAVHGSVVHLDITERKLAELAAEENAERLRRQHETLEHVLERIDGLVREVTDAAVDARSRADVEQRVCESVVATEPYVIAWIGRVDVTGDRIVPQEWAARDGISLDDGELPLREVDGHPAVDALESGDVRVVDDVETFEGADRWWPTTAGEQFRSVAALPLEYGEVTYGVLTVFAAEPNAFDDRERPILQSLAGTIATAINAIEARRLLSADTVIELALSIEDSTPFVADLSASTDAAFEYRGLTYTDDGAAVLLFGVDGDAGIAGAALEAATGYDEVVDATLVADREDESLVEFTVDGGLPALLSEHGAVVRRFDAEAGALELVLDLSDRQSARTVYDRLEQRYDVVELIRYHERERVARTPRDVAARIESELTERQLTALRKAHHAGYYQWPRHVSGEELAASMDISRSTFHQHLRTAERRVLDALFEDHLPSEG